MGTWALAVGLLAGTGVAYGQYGSPQGPGGYQNGQGGNQNGPGGYQGGPGGYQGGGGWDAPPRELRDAARQGFQDGLNGAQKDFENRRRWNVNNRDEFRHPNVAGPLRRDYKMGFKRGYNTGVRHYTQGGPGGQGPRY